MYEDKKENLIIFGISVVLLVVFAIFIRKQTAVSDKELPKIDDPHHGGAVLM